jgi:hypothetical protein
MSVPYGSNLALGVISTDIHPILDGFDVLGKYRFRLTGYIGDHICAGHDDIEITVGIYVNASVGGPYQSKLNYDSASGQISSDSVNLVGHIRGTMLENIQIVWRFPQDAPILAGQSTDILQEDGQTIASTIPVRFNENGEFQVILSVYNHQGRCLAESQPVIVSIDPLEFRVEAGPDRWIEGNNGQLNGKVIGIDPAAVAVQLMLIIGPGQVTFTTELQDTPPISNSPAPLVTFPIEGTYHFQFVATGGDQVRTDEMELIVGRPVTLSAGADIWAVLSGGTATVTTEHAFVYPTEGVTVSWWKGTEQIPDKASPCEEFTFDAVGEYIYTLRVVQNGTTYEDSVTITISREPAAVESDDIVIIPGSYAPVVFPEFLSLNRANIIAPEDAHLSCKWSLANSQGGTVEFWPSQNESRDESRYLRPIVKFSSAGFYTLQLDVYNGDVQDLDHWISYAELAVQVLPEGTITDETVPLIEHFSALINGNSIAGQKVNQGQVDISCHAIDSDSGISLLKLDIKRNEEEPICLKEISGIPVYPLQAAIDYILDINCLSAGKYKLICTAMNKSAKVVSQEIEFSVAVADRSPIASISNLAPDIRHSRESDQQESMPRIETGFFELEGAAYHTDPEITSVEYKLEVFEMSVDKYDPPCWSLFDGSNEQYPNYLVKNIDIVGQTKSNGFYSGSIPQNGTFGDLDFTGVANGVYCLLLTVKRGGASAYASAKFILDSPLKIGNVKFTQEDMVIPVGGITLSVARTYDSFKKDKSGDFGYGWSYSIADMDFTLSEERINYSTYFGGQSYSVRTGTNYDRDVTLTLPDGSRSTFRFYLKYHDMNILESSLPYYTAEYESPTGISAVLETWPQEKMIASVSAGGFDYMWEGQGRNLLEMSDPATYDFEGYRLKTEDGTMYYFARREWFSSEGELFDIAGNPVWVNPKGSDVFLSKIATATAKRLPSTSMMQLCKWANMKIEALNPSLPVKQSPPKQTGSFMKIQTG